MANLDEPILGADYDRVDLSARYIYCITFELEGNGFCRAGIDHRPVYPISEGGLSALVHDCPAAPYRGDRETVARWVTSHAAVIGAAWEATGSVLPVSFDVIVHAAAGRSADQNVRAWLARNGKGLRAKLDQFRDKVELSVQVLWDGVEVARHISASNEEICRLQQEMADRPEDAAHVYRQRIVRMVRELVEAKADADYRTCYERIREHAQEVAVNRPAQRPQRQVLLDLSLLVAREEMPRLGEELAALGAQEGLEVLSTGPWPPYSFAAKIAPPDDDTEGARGGEAFRSRELPD